MVLVDNYSDIKVQVNIHREIILSLETEIYAIRRQMFKSSPRGATSISYDGMPKGSKDYTSMDRLMQRLSVAEQKLETEREIYCELTESKEKIEKNMRKLKGIHYKVAYFRFVKNKSIKEIAEMLGKTENYISKISSEIPRIKNR